MIVYPLEWHRRALRRRPAPRAETFYAAHPFGRIGGAAARCAACGTAPTAPARSRYSEPGRVEHDWHCGCGNEWTTTTEVPS